MIQIVDEITLAPERIPDDACTAARPLPAGPRGAWADGGRPLGITARRGAGAAEHAVADLQRVADAPAYYRMRALTDAGVVGFWMAVDALCDLRRRHVMTDADAPLPALTEVDHAA